MIGIGIGLWQVTMDGQGNGGASRQWESPNAWMVMSLPQPAYVVQPDGVTRQALRWSTYVVEST